MTTRGILTSEFWLTALVIIATTVLTAMGKMTAEQAVGSLGVSGLYALSRGVAKHRDG